MTLEDLGNIGEFVGAIAVVVSLLYLAMQIRQNTRTVRTSTYQAVLDASLRVNENVLLDPALSRIFQVGRRDPAQLDEEELARFRVLVGQHLGLYEALHLQHRQGAIDDDFYSGRLDALRRLIVQPGIRATWDRRGKAYYARSFAALVDGLIADSEDTGADA